MDGGADVVMCCDPLAIAFGGRSLGPAVTKIPCDACNRVPRNFMGIGRDPRPNSGLMHLLRRDRRIRAESAAEGELS